MKSAKEMQRQWDNRFKKATAIKPKKDNSKLIYSLNQILNGKKYQFLSQNGNWVLIDNVNSAKYHFEVGKQIREAQLKTD